MKIFPKKIDRYLLAEVLQPWLGISGFFFFTFLLFQVLRLADFLIVHHAPFWVVIQIAGLMLISFSPFVLPISFLGAVMVGFGRLSTESELAAMKACGMSIGRLVRPVCWLAVGVTVLSLLISLEVAPWSDLTLTRKIYRAGNIQAVQAIQPKTFNSEFFGLMIYADEVDQERGILRNVFIYDEREARSPLVVSAPLGMLTEVRSQSSFSRKTLLELRKGSMHRQQAQGEPIDNMSFDSYKLYLQTEAALGPEPNNMRILAAGELLRRVRGSAKGTHWYWEPLTELGKRLAISTTPLIFAFLGAGLGSIRGRTVASRAYVSTVLLALLYWQVLILCVALSSSGKIAPWFGMALPNLLVGSIAAWSYRKAQW